MAQLTWTTQKRKIKDLLPYEHNPRVLTKEQHTQLKKSLEKFDLAEIPAVDKDTNRIIAGHMRVKILIELGWGEEEIDVRIPNRKLTDEEFKEYNIRSNLCSRFFKSIVRQSDSTQEVSLSI